jgi:hypothetical protein
MKITLKKNGLIACLFLMSSSLIGQTLTDWHYPLYLSNMGYWHSRIPVEVTNSSNLDVSGAAVIIKIGKGKGLLDLAGSRDGAMLALLGIAARKSILESRVVRISELTDLNPHPARGRS